MAEALYRKYRPSTFQDIVGQEHIERTLKNAIEQNKVSHAYLFCGPRGTGKTTTARILAKALLCEKGPTTDPDGTCAECEAIANGNHPDVYELDAASRTGVENVREEIISRVQYAPVRGSFKVYIIDEVHMLSTAAFNALLKTLEEPPEHVIFILCTTDPQKVPETIHSRCQRFDFHRISVDTIVARLGAVCMQEGVEFEPEALELIAYRADGAMRNALTSLEQLIAFGEGNVTLSGAQNLLGSLDDSGLAEIVSAIGMRDVATCFRWTASYVETGADLAQFVLDLAEHIRNLYLLCVTNGEIELSIPDSTRESLMTELKFFSQDRLSRLLGILDEVIKELRVSSNPRLSFEIALTRMVRPESDLTLEALAERLEVLEKRLSGKGGPQSFTAVPVVESSTFMEQSIQSAQSSQPVSFSPETASAVQPATQSVSKSTVSQPVRSEMQPEPGLDSALQSFTTPQIGSASTVQAIPQAPQSAVSQTTSDGDGTQANGVSENNIQVSSLDGVDVKEISTSKPSQSQEAKGGVDLSNPATLQRVWHAIVSRLRKENPARGVLFMNTRVSAPDGNSTILVEFSADSSFAYRAAQKPEVQDLLRRSIHAVVGSSVSFRLELAGDKAAASMSQTVQQSVSQPSIQRQVSQSVQQLKQQPVQHSAQQSGQTAQQPMQPSMPQPVKQPVVSPTTPPPTQPAQSVESNQPFVQNNPLATVSEPVNPQPANQASSNTLQSGSSDSSSKSSEIEEIKSILTASFGEGIKFEEVHE